MDSRTKKARKSVSYPIRPNFIRCFPNTPQVALNPGETHLWFTDLDRSAQDETVNFLLTLLDDQERERALRFRRPILTSRFVAAHGRLRQVLSTYLGVKPQAVRFAYGDRGKPCLAPEQFQALGSASSPNPKAQDSNAQNRDSLPDGWLTETLQFNLSHSDRYGLIAVSHHPVGVDVEQLRPFPSASSLAKRFFSEQEYETLQGLHDSETTLACSQVFLRHWVCKEAYVKATGEGLVDKLHEVIVNFRPEAQFERLPDHSPNWQVHEFSPSDETLAAVVFPSDQPQQFSYWKI